MIHSRVIDPHQVPEIFVAGPFNCAAVGDFVTLTFTHARPNPQKILGGPDAELMLEVVVRARLVMPIDSIRGVQDALDKLLAERSAALTHGADDCH